MNIKHSTPFENLRLSDQNSYLEMLGASKTSVRVEAAETYEILPTPKQYQAGLLDRATEVRLAWAQREDLRPSEQQYAAGLTDKDHLVREAWVERKEMKPTLEQYAFGLLDSSAWVREAWANRMDCTPTSAQLMHCMNDVSLNVRKIWERRFPLLELPIGRSDGWIKDDSEARDQGVITATDRTDVQRRAIEHVVPVAVLSDQIAC